MGHEAATYWKSFRAKTWRKEFSQSYGRLASMMTIGTTAAHVLDYSAMVILPRRDSIAWLDPTLIPIV
jgi:hypothetical protein